MSIDDDANEQLNKPNALLPWAEELANAVDARIRGEEVPTPESVERVLDRAFADVAPRLITARLAQLSPVEFAELYVRVLGGDAFRAQLDQLAEMKSAELQREIRLEQIRLEARARGILRFEQVQPDEIIRIGLFDPRLPQFAGKAYADDREHRPLHRVVALRAIAPTDRTAEVVYDNWVGPVWADSDRTPQLSPLSRGTLGERMALHVQLIFNTERREIRLPQIIGYIETGDGTVLLDGSS